MLKVFEDGVWLLTLVPLVPVNFDSFGFISLFSFDGDIKTFFQEDAALQKEQREWDDQDNTAIGFIEHKLPSSAKKVLTTFSDSELIGNTSQKGDRTALLLWNRIKQQYGTQSVVVQYGDFLFINHFHLNIDKDPQHQFAQFEEVLAHQEAKGWKTPKYDQVFHLVTNLPDEGPWGLIKQQILSSKDNQSELKMEDAKNRITDFYRSQHQPQPQKANIAISGQHGNQYQGKKPYFSSQQSAPNWQHQNSSNFGQKRSRSSAGNSMRSYKSNSFAPRGRGGVSGRGRGSGAGRGRGRKGPHQQSS
ncbi:hypothetical protein VKT23_019378 [Stygiomarasmius scandens]|uniref:Uncharacterized protein n=1 Tax=Marasmiellus scandens TaxID=2682957 RepID=A0ABR1ILJ7_9AGAR